MFPKEPYFGSIAENMQNRGERQNEAGTVKKVSERYKNNGGTKTGKRAQNLTNEGEKEK